MHVKRKLEVIIEAPASRLVLDILDRGGATGYTVLSPVAGRGSGGSWDISPVTDARQQVMIIATVAPDRVEALVDEVAAVLAHYHGVIFVSTVEVVRSERF